MLLELQSNDVDYKLDNEQYDSATAKIIEKKITHDVY